MYGVCACLNSNIIQAWVGSRKRSQNFQRRSLGVLQEKTHTGISSTSNRRP